MTTSSECFMKQVKANVCTAFGVFIRGVIMLWPLIVFAVYWFSLPSPTTEGERMYRALLLGGDLSITSVVMVIYDWMIAIPFIKCFFGEDILK